MHIFLHIRQHEKRRFFGLILHAVLIACLVCPPTWVLAKGDGPSEAELYGEIEELEGRDFVVDLPAWEEIEDCSIEEAPALSLRPQKPAPLFFDGDQSIYLSSAPCDATAIQEAALALYSFRMEIDRLWLRTYDPKTGQVEEVEVEGGWQERIAHGFVEELKTLGGENALHAFLAILGGFAVGAGLTFAAASIPALAPVITVAVLLTGLYIIHVYQELLYQDEFEEIGRHMLWDLLFAGSAFGGGRSLPLLKRGGMALAQKIPEVRVLTDALQSFLRRRLMAGEVDRVLARANQYADDLAEKEINRLLQETWQKGTGRPPALGSSGKGRRVPRRPFDTDGGVRVRSQKPALKSDRPLPNTKLVRKDGMAPSTEIGAASQTLSVGGGHVAWMENTQNQEPISDGVASPSTKIEYGYAEGANQHQIERFNEYHLQRQGISNSIKSTPLATTLNQADHSGEPPDTPPGWRHSQPEEEDLFWPIATPTLPTGGDEHIFAEKYRTKFGLEDFPAFNELIHLFLAFERVRRGRQIFRLIEENGLMLLWKQMKGMDESGEFELSNAREILHPFVLRYERATSPRNDRGVQSRAETRAAGLVQTVVANGGNPSPVTLLEAMGLKEELNAISSKPTILKDLFELLHYIPVEHHAQLFSSFDVFGRHHLNATVARQMNHQTPLFFEHHTSDEKVERTQAQHRRKIWGNIVRLHESMGFVPLYRLLKASTSSSSEGPSPLQTFMKHLSVRARKVGGIYSAYFEALRGVELSRAPFGTRPAPLKRWMGNTFPKGTEFHFLGRDPRTRKVLAILPGQTRVYVFSVHTNHRREMRDAARRIHTILLGLPRLNISFELPTSLRDQVMTNLGRSVEKEIEMFELERFQSRWRVPIHDLQVGSRLDPTLPPPAFTALQKIRRQRELLEVIRRDLSPELGYDEAAGVWRPIIP